MSASLAPECSEVKEYGLRVTSADVFADFNRRYDSCFLKWYSESVLFIASNSASNS